MGTCRFPSIFLELGLIHFVNKQLKKVLILYLNKQGKKDSQMDSINSPEVGNDSAGNMHSPLGCVSLLDCVYRSVLISLLPRHCHHGGTVAISTLLGNHIKTEYYNAMFNLRIVAIFV